MTTDDAKAVLHRGHAAHAPRERFLDAEEGYEGRGAAQSVGRVGYGGMIVAVARGTDLAVCGSTVDLDA